MSTQLQIFANRKNAKKSTGPRTPRGKAAVSKNALKHGLFTRRDVIFTEKQADFDIYRSQLIEELSPETPVESVLAERLVTLAWRLKRTCRIQNQTIDTLEKSDTPSPLVKLTQSIIARKLGLPSPPDEKPDTNLALGRLAVKDFSNSRVIDRLFMYERRMEHSFYKTLLEYQRQKIMNKTELGSQLPFNLPNL